MKKMMSAILTAIMAVSMIGGATVTTAQAETEATCVADVVAFMKECRPGETLMFRPMDNVTIRYEWVYTDPKEVEAWLLLLTDEQKVELDEMLADVGATTDDISGWNVQEHVTRWQTLGL